MITQDSSPVSLYGSGHQSGVYLLHIQLSRPAAVSFGRHNAGQAVALPEGGYLYIGSAHGQKGASALGYRLLRHTARSGKNPAHPIQTELAAALAAQGMIGKPPQHKTLRWHIDYLLDLGEAEIVQILAWRTADRPEFALAARLNALTETAVISPGLGASDHPGSTHLLYVGKLREGWEKAQGVFTSFVD